MDISQASSKEKSEFYQALDKLVRSAKQKNYNYEDELANLSTKLNKEYMDLRQFETVLKTIDPFVVPHLELLTKYLKEPEHLHNYRTAIGIVKFKRKLKEMEIARENLTKLILTAKDYIEKNNLTPEKFFNEFYNSRTESIGPFELNKLLDHFKITFTVDEKMMLFLTINNYEQDSKISLKQWVDTYTDITKAFSATKDQEQSLTKAREIDDMLFKVSPIISKFKDAMNRAGYEKFKIYLEKNKVKIEEGKITGEDFETSARDILPTLNYHEMTELKKCFEKDGKVNIEMPDEFIRECSRFGSDSKGKFKSRSQ